MRKFIITATSIAALAVVPAASMASAPNGEFNFKANDGARSAHASVVGELSSQITQNGQFVSGQDDLTSIDQTTTPGSRAAIVQDALGH